MDDHKPIVFIVDDDEALCASLKWLLESIGINVEIYSNGPDFLTNYKHKQYGCLLIDIRMPMMSGLQLQEKLAAINNTMPIIFMTGHGDIPMAVRAMKTGALDFITKPFNDQLLIEQIQKAIAISTQPQTNIQHNELITCYKSLSPREKEILEKISAGKLNKQIAYELEVSIKTVELHRSNVMRKMKVNTLAALIKNHMMLNQINNNI